MTAHLVSFIHTSESRIAISYVHESNLSHLNHSGATSPSLEIRLTIPYTEDFGFRLQCFGYLKAFHRHSEESSTYSTTNLNELGPTQQRCGRHDR